MRLIAATWISASRGMEEAWKILEATGSAEDAAEYTVAHVEDDPLDVSVGYGGGLTSEGAAEMDAAFMEGRYRRIGAVAGLVGYRSPVHVARLVMERTPHNLLAGAGASRFAERMCCEPRDMITPESRAAWEAYRRDRSGDTGHDTVGAIALVDGHFVCAMSTSGLLFRLPGRVSDSALPAAGYFCDDTIGAAVATGVGEDIMRGALASRVVFYMEQGEPAGRAAHRAVTDVHTRIRDLGRVAVVAVDKNGCWGGAANHDVFSVSYIDRNGLRVEKIPYAMAGSGVSVGREWQA